MAAGRHTDQSRRALRHRCQAAGRRADDQGRSRHRDRERWARRGDAAAAPASHRETAVVDEAYRCIGLITVKDIEKRSVSRTPPRTPTAVCGAAAATGTGEDASHARGAVCRRHRRARRRHRARPFGPCHRGGEAHPRLSNYTQIIAGNIATAKGSRPRRGGRRRGQSRHRSGLDLHHPCRRRGRRAQLTAILDVVEECRKSDVPVIG